VRVHRQGSTDGTEAVVLSRETIVEKISSIRAEGIAAIAKKIVSLVMGRLEVDMTPVHMFDEQGQRKVCDQIYDPESSLMTVLLPLVSSSISIAFSTPDQFADEGLKIPFFDLNDTGLLDQLQSNEDLSKEIIDAISLTKASYNENNFSCCIDLKLHHEHSEDELMFTMTEPIPGHTPDFHWGTIRDFEESAQRCTIHT
jgi:hypothetical protein